MSTILLDSRANLLWKALFTRTSAKMLRRMIKSLILLVVGLALFLSGAQIYFNLPPSIVAGGSDSGFGLAILGIFLFIASFAMIGVAFNSIISPDKAGEN